MHIRDRIKELRRVPASELKPHPQNWRVHPPEQQNALRAVLAEIGYAGALLAREAEDGSLELIDGHLRAETTPDHLVPVLVLDVAAAEASKILATHDTITGMAGISQTAFSKLTRDCRFANPVIQDLFNTLNTQERKPPDERDEPADLEIPASFQIVVTCEGEDDQQTLYQRLSDEGFVCRLLVL